MASTTIGRVTATNAAKEKLTPGMARVGSSQTIGAAPAPPVRNTARPPLSAARPTGGTCWLAMVRPMRYPATVTPAVTTSSTVAETMRVT